MSISRQHCLLRAVLLVGLLAICACSPDDPVEAVRKLHAEGSYAESIEPLRALLDARPEDPEVQFLYGVALRRTGQPSLALWVLREAEGQPGWEVPAGLELAASAFQSQNFEAAVEAATRVIAREPDNVQAIRLRGEAQLASRADVELALADFDRLLEDDPSNVDVQVSRAGALLLLKRIEEAEEALEQLERTADEAHLGEDTRAAYCVARATFALERGEPEVAEDRYEDCLARYPGDATVVSEALAFFDARGQSERATDLLREAIERSPEAVVLRDGLSKRLWNAGDEAGGVAVLRAGTELESPAVAAFCWRALADHYMAQGRTGEAATSLEQAFALEEPTQQLLLAHADLVAAAGDPERAREIARGLDHPFFLDLIEARILLNERQPRQAIQHFESAFRFWPDNAAARYYTARAAEALGDFDRAIEEYRQSIRAGAHFTDAGWRLALLYEAQGAHRPALGALAHHTKAHGNSAETLIFELRLRAQTGERTRVRRLLAMLRGTPSWAEAINALAQVAAARRGPLAGAQVIRNETDLDLRSPENAVALRSLSRYLIEAGEADDAGALVDAAIERNPESPAFREIRGFVLEQRGDEDAARAEYQRTLELEPESARALSGLARLASGEGDVEAAIAYYERAGEADPDDPATARSAADLLARGERVSEAEQRLEDLLWEHPYDSAAALQLARLQLTHGGATDQTRELVRRAQRFGGGPEAASLLEQLETAPPASDS